jgi:hypothetical protein
MCGGGGRTDLQSASNAIADVRPPNIEKRCDAPPSRASERSRTSLIEVPDFPVEEGMSRFGDCGEGWPRYGDGGPACLWSDPRAVTPAP